MSRSYIPTRDADFKAWVTNFSAYITANTVAVGLVAGDATALATLVTAYNAAQVVVDTPATKTSVTVDAKNVAKAALIADVRILTAKMRSSGACSDAELLAMGLPVYDTTKSPIPAPATQPIISIMNATPLQQTLRFSDSDTPTKRAKAPHAAGLQVFVAINTGGATTPDDGVFHTFATKQPFVVDFVPGDVGKKATYYARWQTATGLVGPWSTPVSMTIA